MANQPPAVKRITILLSLAGLLALAFPARADLATASTTTGTVETAVVSPVPQKNLYNANGPNGTFGFVITLTGGDGSYSLTRLSGFGHLDAYFFKAGSGGTIGDSCSSQSHDDSTVFDIDFAADQFFDATETGTICPGTDTGKYAIIVARTGVNIPFSFTG